MDNEKKYTTADLVSFGNHVLSPERTKRLTETAKLVSNPDIINTVWDSDLDTWPGLQVKESDCVEDSGQ